MKQSDFDRLSDSVEDMVSQVNTGKPLPVRSTRYVGKVKIEVIMNGRTTWSLEKALEQLPELNLGECTSYADVIRTAMRFLDQGDEGFAQLVGISVSTIRAWKQGGRKPRGPGRRLLEVSLQYPQIMLDVVRDSAASFA